MGVRLSVPDGSKEIRRLALDWVVPGTSYDTDVEVVADAAGATNALLACSEVGWLQVSEDGGSSWQAVPSEAQYGVELGPLAANERKTITLRLMVAIGDAVRQQSVELKIGLGK